MDAEVPQHACGHRGVRGLQERVPGIELAVDADSADNITLDRFVAKLQKNRASLVERYGCKAVRFQVYVKDGKAALKATAIK